MTAPKFSPEALRALKEYPWPGNVRELENAIEYSLVINIDDVLGLDDLPLEIVQKSQSTNGNELKQLLKAYIDDTVPLAEIEKRYILSVLQQFGGNQVQTAAALGEFHALHPVSAKTGDGIGELREELVGLLPEGPLYFPPEQRTDLSVETQIAELVREQALRLTKEEVPHAVSAEVEEIEDKVVRANVFVETESQKQILVGKGGSMVRQIGTRARPEIEALLGRKVFLDLQVKVRPKWRRDEAMLERLGL